MCVIFVWKKKVAANSIMYTVVPPKDYQDLRNIQRFTKQMLI